MKAFIRICCGTMEMGAEEKRKTLKASAHSVVENIVLCL